MIYHLLHPICRYSFCSNPHHYKECLSYDSSSIVCRLSMCTTVYIYAIHTNTRLVANLIVLLAKDIAYFF